MGYKQALRKIDELRDIVTIFDQKQDSGIPQEAINIALERVKRVFDMIEYDADYDDNDIETVVYGDENDLAILEQLFTPQMPIIEEQTFALEEEYVAEEEPYFAAEEYVEEVPMPELVKAPIVMEYVRAIERSDEEIEHVAAEEKQLIRSKPIAINRVYSDATRVEQSTPAPATAPAPAPKPVHKAATKAAPAPRVAPMQSQPQPAQVQNEEEEVQRLVAAYNKRRSDRYRKILSLYVDHPVEERQPQPQITNREIVERAMERVMRVDHRVDVNALLPEAFKELNDDGIVLLTNELFDGDTESFIATLLTIDEQPNLEEAIFYIAENFVWDGDSDAAKLLFTLLQRRFS